MSELNDACNQHHPGWRCRGFRRMTVPRQIILEKMRSAQEPLSAEELYLSVHQVYPQIGLATVYRTLELLAQDGEVARLDLGDRKARYTILTQATVHNYIHLVCTRCGTVQEFLQLPEATLNNLIDLTTAIAAEANFQLKVNHLQLRGVCQHCQKQQEPTIERNAQ